VATDQSDVPDNSIQFDIGCGPPVATGHSQVPFISGQFDVSDGLAAATNVVEIPAEVLHNIGQFDIDDVHFLSTNSAEIPENTGQFDISDGYPMASDPAEVPVNSGQFDIGSGHPAVVGLADSSKRLSNALRNALEVLNFDGVNTHNVLNQNELCEDSAVDDTANLRSRARCKKSPALWKCNVRKRLRNSGQSYTDRCGAQKSRKVMKPGCGLKCHKHCHQLISLDDREWLFHDFWQLGNLSDQREYLVRHVIRKPVKSKSKNSPNHNHVKKFSFHYSFVVKNTTISVCKIFFLHTLAISQQMVHTTCNKLADNGHLQTEKRCSPSTRKLSSELRNDIRDHINKFPTIESHYCRKNSRKAYLAQGLTLAEMYRLYTQECSLSGKPVAKQWAYNDIFHNEFNLGFYKPKKDQCDFCMKYKHLDDDGRASIADKMEKHQQNKTLVRELKSKLKEQAKTDQEINVACFDLQQVLLTPHSMSSQLFYRRKLSTFNLTVYDIGTKSGYCYMWHEGVARRGANNIASCVWNYINHMNEKSKTEFHFFTDNCCGQNKNKLILSMYFHAVKTLNVERICHYYLEKGHTENEGDSMHSTIEAAAKNVNIFSPMQWYTVAGTAKKSGTRYLVVEMEGQMKDFKGLSEKYTMGSKLRWADIKCLKVEKTHPNSLFVKNGFGCENYTEIQFGGKEVLGHQSDSHSDFEGEQYAYTGFDNLPALESESMVTSAKKNDLAWMCEQLIIPKDYHPFYVNLNVCSQQPEQDAVREDSGQEEILEQQSSDSHSSCVNVMKEMQPEQDTVRSTRLRSRLDSKKSDSKQMQHHDKENRKPKKRKANEPKLSSGHKVVCSKK